MNWGNGIALFFAAFILFMLSLVFICMKQDNLHLVTQNYYEEEIKYQQQIDRVNNASKLDYKIFTYHAEGKNVNLNLPTGAVGTLHLFRPSDARLDRKFQVTVGNDGTCSIDLGNLPSGYWKMMLSWNEGGTEYYMEEKITI